MNPESRTFHLAASFLAAAAALTAQTLQPPRLLKNIDPSKSVPYSSNPMSRAGAPHIYYPPFLTVGNLFFFSADDGLHGREIWLSMGLPGTTRMTADLVPGRGGTNLLYMAWFKGSLYFDGWDPSHGREIWRFQGAPGGAALFQDSFPGRDSGEFIRPLVEGGFLWFFAQTSSRNYTLFKYDGSQAPPAAVKSGFSSEWREPAVLGGKVLFVTQIKWGMDDLWITDGTGKGTRLLLHSQNWLQELTAAGGRLYFARGGSSGLSVWGTDGTKVFKILDLGAVPSGWFPAVLGTRILFPGPLDKLGNRDLWVLDGPTGKTSLLKKLPNQTPLSWNAWRPVQKGKNLYFCVSFGYPGRPEIWRTDGTPAGTGLVTRRGVLPSSSWTDPTPAGNLVFFGGGGPALGEELWVTDGTDKGTRLVKDIAPGMSSSSPLYITSLGRGRVAFSARTPREGREPWVSDGTAAGTYILRDIYPGVKGANSSPQFMTDFYGRCFFSAQEPAHGRELWASDGTPGGTALFKDVTPGTLGSYPYCMFTLGDKFFFYIPYPGIPGLRATDGTPGGTVRISPVHLITWMQPFTVGKKALFLGVDSVYGVEPWVTDGTANGTMLLKDTDPGSSYPKSFDSAVSGSLVFFAMGPWKKYALWVSDLTPAGTKPVAKDLERIDRLVVLGNKLLFQGRKNSLHGTEPWVSDGTPAGTHELLDLAPGSRDGGFRAPFVLGKYAYFFGTDGKTLPAGSYGLFRTDGTGPGTTRVGKKTFVLHPYKSYSLGKKALFWAKDWNHGFEPWVTDGTAAGTRLLRDLVPGPESTGPIAFLKTGKRKGIFVLQGFHGIHPLLVTDGTPKGTFFLPGPGPGKTLDCSEEMGFSGGKVYFGADDGSTGKEPWTWFPGATAQTVGWSQGKARLDGQDPVLGGKFRLTVTEMPKGGAGILLLGRPLSRPILLAGGAGLFPDPA
ncbi:MAG TPA: hypothetical protein ENJ97_07335, partial [Planctomycetes bacterium]|nr:hypothetical protein [Planctomycetota bacterium]